MTKHANLNKIIELQNYLKKVFFIYKEELENCFDFVKIIKFSIQIYKSGKWLNFA
jgi:hypothetical protein